MARPRSELHAILKDILGSDHVYFQPPPSVALVYPCIVYKRDLSQTEYADNAPYAYTQRYQVTVIDRDPDSDIPQKVAALPMCLFIRFYTADNLNHDVFNLFF
jgi:hypothetical protein